MWKFVSASFLAGVLQRAGGAHTWFAASRLAPRSRSSCATSVWPSALATSSEELPSCPGFGGDREKWKGSLGNTDRWKHRAKDLGTLPPRLPLLFLHCTCAAAGGAYIVGRFEVGTAIEEQFGHLFVAFGAD